MPISEELEAQIKETHERYLALVAKKEALLHKEAQDAIATIKDLMGKYSLTVKDLGLGAVKAKKIKSIAGFAKYKSGENSWSGRGPHPQWIKDYLAQSPNHKIGDLAAK